VIDAGDEEIADRPPELMSLNGFVVAVPHHE